MEIAIHDVGAHDVVDEGHVLVTDALDVVLTEPVVEEGRALQRLDGDGERPKPVLQVVPGADRAGRSCRRNERTGLELGP